MGSISFRVLGRWDNELYTTEEPETRGLSQRKYLEDLELKKKGGEKKEKKENKEKKIKLGGNQHGKYSQRMENSRPSG